MYAEKLGYSTYVAFTSQLKAVDTSNTTVVVNTVPASSQPFNGGTTNVIATATDLAGNKADCNFTVTVTGN